MTMNSGHAVRRCPCHGVPERAHHRRPAGGRYASAHAKEYQDGLIIDDALFRIVDTGEDWQDYAGAEVRAPLYAVRRLA